MGVSIIVRPGIIAQFSLSAETFRKKASGRFTLILGDVLSVLLTLRDERGALIAPAEAISVEVFAITVSGGGVESIAGSATLEVVAVPYVLDGVEQVGRYHVKMPTSGLSAGRWLIRANVPYGNGNTASHEQFELLSATDSTILDAVR